jgi:SPP1 family predicted phage head-tail adaptor
MQAGRLKHRVVVQHLVTGSPQYTPSGETSREWTDLVTVWASIEPLRGRELFAAQEHAAETEVRIRIRYREGIVPAMRVYHEDKYYDILSVIDPDYKHRELELLCSTGVIDG